MPRVVRKRIEVEAVLLCITVALAVIAAFILDKDSAPHRWHPAVAWTAVTFFTLVLWCREKWRALSFWLFWLASLFLQAGAMWLIFGRVLVRLSLGTLFVMPIAFVESIFLALVFLRLERRLRRNADMS